MFRIFLIFFLLMPFASSAKTIEAPNDISVLKAKAEKGDLQTQAALCNGNSVTKDLKAHWCLMAAEQGSIWAASTLGELYEGGQGVPQDFVQAYMWYSLNPDAFEKLDEITKKMTSDQILKGKHLSADWQDRIAKETVKGYHEKSAGLLCMRNMFMDFKSIIEKCPGSINVKKDLEKAYFWESLASSSSNIKDAEAVRHTAGKQLTQEQRFVVQGRVLKWYPIGQEDGKAEFEKGAQYKGQDNEEAARWFLKAAEKGNTDAQYALGNLYAEGDSGMSDTEFVKILNRAIDRINDYIVVNSSKPVTKKELEDQVKNFVLPYGCMGSQNTRSMINSFKTLPPKDFQKIFEDPLPASGPPQWEPCF